MKNGYVLSESFLHLLLWLIFRQSYPNFINIRTAYASKIWTQLTKNLLTKYKHKKNSESTYNGYGGTDFMKFRPCIDIHNGKVKTDRRWKPYGRTRIQASENFVSEQDASFYAELYKKAGIKGGHVILLNGHDSPYYESTKEQAILALHTYPGGLQIGGGVNPENAGEYLSAGASHVIVTSYVFKDGRISWENLNKMKETVGKEKLVLDLSCRRKDGKYYIVTDRWQKFTDVTMTLDIMKELGSYCNEFLVHAVDVEGKARGVETELASLLGEYKGNPVTYAGGVGSMKDIEDLRKYGKDRLDVTVGSALDLFGGNISFSELIKL